MGRIINIEEDVIGYFIYMFFNFYLVLAIATTIVNRYISFNKGIADIYFTHPYWGKFVGLFYNLRLFNWVKRENVKIVFLLIYPLLDTLNFLLSMPYIISHWANSTIKLDIFLHAIIWLLLARIIWMNRELKILAHKLNQE